MISNELLCQLASLGVCQHSLTIISEVSEIRYPSILDNEK